MRAKYTNIHGIEQSAYWISLGKFSLNIRRTITHDALMGTHDEQLITHDKMIDRHREQ